MPEDETDEQGEIKTVQDVSIVGSKDWFLQSIIENIIARGVEIGITFTVGGSIISGILISGEKYFEELGESLKSASVSADDFTNVLGDSWKAFKAIYAKPEDAPDDWQYPEANFAHLRGARFFVPGHPPIPTNKGVLWRGKLSSIAGFSVGNFSAN